MKTTGVQNITGYDRQEDMSDPPQDHHAVPHDGEDFYPNYGYLRHALDRPGEPHRLLAPEMERLCERVEFYHLTQGDFDGDEGFTQIVYDREYRSDEMDRLAEYYRLPSGVIVELIQLLAAFNYLPAREVTGRAEFCDLVNPAQPREFEVGRLPCGNVRQVSYREILEASSPIYHFLVQLAEILEFPRFRELFENQNGRPFDLLEFLGHKEFFGKPTLFCFGDHVKNRSLEETLTVLLATFQAKKVIASDDPELFYRLLPPTGIQFEMEPGVGRRDKADYPANLNREICRVMVDGKEMPVFLAVENAYSDSDFHLILALGSPECSIYKAGVRFEVDSSTGELVAVMNTVQYHCKNLDEQLNPAGENEPILKRPRRKVVDEVLPAIERELGGSPKLYLIHALKALFDRVGIRLEADDPETNLWIKVHQNPELLQSCVRQFREGYQDSGMDEHGVGYRFRDGPIRPDRILKREHLPTRNIHFVTLKMYGMKAAVPATSLLALHFIPEKARMIGRCALEIFGLEQDDGDDEDMFRDVEREIGVEVRSAIIHLLQKELESLLDNVQALLTHEQSIDEDHVRLALLIDRDDVGVEFLLRGRQRVAELIGVLRNPTATSELKREAVAERERTELECRLVLGAMISGIESEQLQPIVECAKKWIYEGADVRADLEALGVGSLGKMRRRVKSDVEEFMRALDQYLMRGVDVHAMAERIVEAMSPMERGMFLQNGALRLPVPLAEVLDAGRGGHRPLKRGESG